MPIDYSKLRGRIIEKCGTNAIFAKKMGWSERTMSLKINCRIQWKQDEILKATRILDLRIEDIQTYFFELKVQNIEPLKK